MLLTSCYASHESRPMISRVKETKSQSRRFAIEGVMDFGIPAHVSVARDASFDDVLVCIISFPHDYWVLEWIGRTLRSRCSLFHPHVLKICDALITEDQFHVVCEFPQGENLLQCLSTTCFSEDICRNLFQQLIFAVDYYHCMGIDGLDLSLDRVFFDSESYLLKIIDFGLASHGTKGKATYALPYVAPEQLSTPSLSAKHNKASDVWHCGVLLYCMLFRSFPFSSTDDDSREKHITNILSARWRVPSGYQLSDACIDLLSRMFTRDPSSRLSVGEIKTHPWYLTNLPSGVHQYKIIDRPSDGLVQRVDKIAKVWISTLQE